MLLFCCLIWIYLLLLTALIFEVSFTPDAASGRIYPITVIGRRRFIHAYTQAWIGIVYYRLLWIMGANIVAFWVVRLIAYVKRKADG